MELIRGLHNLRPEHRGCAATIGNFDGVHLGHQAVLAELRARAAALGVPSLVMLFEPQPREHFDPDSAPARLMRLREKLVALRGQGVDRVLCVRFDDRFAALPADAFVERILLEGLGVRYLVVGRDFRFGRGRLGDIEQLARAGRAHGFEVAAAATFTIDGERVSSTRVRVALADGALDVAARLLGRPYRMCGRVVHGSKLGRRLGIPTANIRLHRRRSPLHGIFVAEMRLGEECWPAAVSIGRRPTVGGSEMLLEVHLLDVERNLYGNHVAVDLLQKLREERRFESVEEMRVHILRDIENVRQFFLSRQQPPAIVNRISPQ